MTIDGHSNRMAFIGQLMIYMHLLLCCHLDLGPEDAGVHTLSCTSKFYFYNVGQRFAEVQMKVFLCQVIPLLSSLAVS